MALSDWLAPLLQIGSTVLGVQSQLSKGQAIRTTAGRRQRATEFEAQQMEAEATQSRGLGLRGAADETLKAENVMSTALARAAASGAGASDPTVMNVIARTAGEGAYRSAVAMYEGEAQARLDMMKAAALRYEGATGVSDAESAARMTRFGAGATALSGAVKSMSMYDKYFSGPTKTNNPAGIAAGGGDSSGAWLDTGTQFMDSNA